jgi:hypothetical protein
MRRVRNWDSALAAYFAARQNMPFQYGRNDCCAFANAGLQAQGCSDLMRGIRAYKSARGAMAAMARVGGLEAAVQERLEKAGLRSCDVRFAGRGCPVLAEIETPEGRAVAAGLVGLDGVSALFPGMQGLVRYPRPHWLHAWAFD